MAVRYERLVPILIEAIKELEARELKLWRVNGFTSIWTNQIQ